MSSNESVASLFRMSFKLKRFDVHSKAVDGVTEQTTLGALVTFIMYGLIIYLLYSEMNIRSDSETISRMVLDTSGSARRILDTKIEYDVEFYKVSCDRITFTQEVTRGERHNDPLSNDVITKVPTLSDKLESCHVFGSLVTDKVGGNFRFEISALESEINASKQKEMTGLDEGQRMLSQETIDMLSFTTPDISHKINHILFLETKAEEAVYQVPSSAASSNILKLESRPLNGQESNVPVGVGIHHYSIQVVPTTFKSHRDKPKHINQYSVTERQVDFEQALSGVTVAGQYFSNFVGVVFTYDFYPVRPLYSMISTFYIDCPPMQFGTVPRKLFKDS